MHPSFLQGIRSNALGPLAKVHVDLTNCFLSPRELEQFAVAVTKNIAKNGDILCPIQTINLSGNEICAVDASGEGKLLDDFDCLSSHIPSTQAISSTGV
jgi:hypothetical protein